MRDVLCVILGGGRGKRLYPLTKYRAKPAVPLLGKYRLIDIPISNCVNSGLERIAILTQFNSESLNKHISRAYKFGFFSKGFVDIIAAEQSMEQGDWFQGSADAVRKCLKHFNDPHIKFILVLSGDQVYKMNFQELIDYHIRKKSQITIACTPVSEEEVLGLGVMGMDKNSRIKKFVEKPNKKSDVASLAIKVKGKGLYPASMGIYVFNREVLFDLLTNNKKVDFGREVMPDAIRHKITHGFIHTGYWRDIGSIRSFYEVNLAFTERKAPIDLFDEDWPFLTRPRYLPVSKIFDTHVEASNIAEGAIIQKAKITHSIIGLRSVIDSGTSIEDSVIIGNDYYDDAQHAPGMTGVSSVPQLGIGKDCHIQKAIVDKNARIGDGVKIINKDKKQEFEDNYCTIRSGIVIIPKNTIIPPGTVL